MKVPAGGLFAELDHIPARLAVHAAKGVAGIALQVGCRWLNRNNPPDPLAASRPTRLHPSASRPALSQTSARLPGLLVFLYRQPEMTPSGPGIEARTRTHLPVCCQLRPAQSRTGRAPEPDPQGRQGRQHKTSTQTASPSRALPAPSSRIGSIRPAGRPTGTRHLNRKQLICNHGGKATAHPPRQPQGRRA